ncbi:MAG: hypothetical protein EA405_01510 [Rhodospirillales bacterium]|nr:MAG: hypothetical protein EA405_01510 [Rhodospirillales bacterium]
MRRWLRGLAGRRPGTLSLDDVAWRQDRYLVRPGCTDLGIKIREGRLEVKGRLAIDGLAGLGRAGQGCVESWAKWSLPPDPRGGAWWQHLAQVEAGAGFVTVAKHRWLWSGALGTDPGPNAPQIQVEVTRLRCGRGDETEAWTLGIEAAPLAAWPGHEFTEVTACLLDAAALPVLTASRSMGYPAWLAGQGGADQAF